MRSPARSFSAPSCHRFAGLFLLALLGFATTSQAEAPPQFLRRPDVSGDQIVFTSEGDLWLGSLERGIAMRVTSDEGSEGPAFFSPDGLSLAFTAEYDGGRDVYVMDVIGGAPRRLTWDPTGVTVLGWEMVGGYAIQFHFSDGHNTGIYSYRYLREIAERASS